MPRIESCVLHDDRLVGLDYRREVGVARHRGRIGQVVEAQMQGAPRADRYGVGTDRIAILEVKRDGDFGVTIAGVQEADGLVRDERMRLAHALARNVALGDSPTTMSDCG